MSKEGEPIPEQESFEGLGLMGIANAVLMEYAKKQARAAVARIERIRTGQWMPKVTTPDGEVYDDYQTINICIKLANQWIDFLAPKTGVRWHYDIRDVGDTYQVFHHNPDDEDEGNARSYKKPGYDEDSTTGLEGA
jgi:hypothetical protein